MRMWIAVVLAAGTLLGCGGDDAATDDAPAVDAAIDAATNPDAAGGLPTTCTGACATTALTATFGNATRVLDVAYYGLTKSATETSIRVEAYHGAAPGCPSETTPSPDQTVILVALAIPTSTAVLMTNTTLLDFEGALTTEPAAHSSATSYTPTAANVCPDCVGMTAPSDPDGLVAVDASITFPNGMISGHLFASHCDSLDATD